MRAPSPMITIMTGATPAPREPGVTGPTRGKGACAA
jgi:hypothetical protein